VRGVEVDELDPHAKAVVVRGLATADPPLHPDGLGIQVEGEIVNVPHRQRSKQGQERAAFAQVEEARGDLCADNSGEEW